MKVIKSLEDRGILLKGTTRKITSQKGEFLNFLRPLMTAGSPLMTNVVTSLAKSVLLPFTLMAGLSVTDTAIQKKKKKIESEATALIISNEEIEDIMKIVQSLEESSLLIEDISETIKNDAKEQKGRFLEILLGILCASSLGHVLTRQGVIRAGEGTTR